MQFWRMGNCQRSMEPTSLAWLVRPRCCLLHCPFGLCKETIRAHMSQTTTYGFTTRVCLGAEPTTSLLHGFPSQKFCSWASEIFVMVGSFGWLFVSLPLKAFSSRAMPRKRCILARRSGNDLGHTPKKLYSLEDRESPF